MNNTKRKELGLWIEPSSDVITIRQEKKRIHRLFNPKEIKRLQTEDTIKYLRVRKIIKDSRRTGVNCLLKELRDFGIYPRVVELPNRMHPELVQQPRKPSMVTENMRILTYTYSWTNKDTRKHRGFISWESKHIKPDLEWSEELHSFIRPRPTNIKKEKKISPYWTQKLLEWEQKKAS
jgi:hypothetical protein